MIGGAAQICMDYPIFALLVVVVGIVILLVMSKTYREGESFSPINLVNHLSKEDLLNEIKKLKDDLYNSIVKTQTCERTLAKRAQECGSGSDSDSEPSRVYTTDTTRFYQIGYVESGSQFYPLFGRRLYRQRSDKWEYYIIEGSENKVRIPIKTTNDNELNDGDSITIGGKTYAVKLYEYKGVRYNPSL